MSSIPLSTIQEKVERSIYERIRLECVNKGYLPDITLYMGPPPQQGAYENAIKIIVNNKGFVAEVFSASSSHGKNLKKVPRIVIVPQDFMPGETGGDRTRIFRSVEGGFNAFILPPQSVSYNFNIHIIAKDAIQFRILRSIVANAVPRRGYVNFIDDPTDNFFVRNYSYYTFDDTEEGVIEKVYAYEIPDLYDTDEEPTQGITGDLIPPITQITVVQNINEPNPENPGLGDVDEMIIE